MLVHGYLSGEVEGSLLHTGNECGRLSHQLLTSWLLGSWWLKYTEHFVQECTPQNVWEAEWSQPVRGLYWC